MLSFLSNNSLSWLKMIEKHFYELNQFLGEKLVGRYSQDINGIIMIMMDFLFTLKII